MNGEGVGVACRVSGKNGMRVMITELTRLLRVYDGQQFLYVSESEKYRIFKVDLKNKKVVDEFTPDYQSVPYVKKVFTEEIENKLHSLTDRKYYNDIYMLRQYRGKLLVFTSTMNKKGEVRVDVMDSSGKFPDHFFHALSAEKIAH